MALPALPRFTAPTRREQTVLDASREVVGLFLQARSSDFSVRELADRTRLAERTFYRYFPRKEDAIRPYLRAGLEHLVEAIRRAPRDIPLRDVLVGAHAGLLDLAVDERASAFLSVADGNERLRAAWLTLLTDAEILLTEVIAHRLGLPPESTRARLAGSVTVAAGRLALESASDPTHTEPPSRVFADCLDLLGAGLFHAEHPPVAGGHRS